MPIDPTLRAQMPPHALRNETPPARRPVLRSRPIEQTPHHRADEIRFRIPTARSRCRAATPPPPDSPLSARRNAGPSARLPSQPLEHAPTAEAGPPTAPRPHDAHAASESRSQQPAYEPRRPGAQPMLSAAMTAQPAGIRRLPAGFATLRPPSAAAPACPQPISTHISKASARPASLTTCLGCTRYSPPYRAAMASRRANARAPASAQGVRTFFTEIKQESDHLSVLELREAVVVSNHRTRGAAATSEPPRLLTTLPRARQTIGRLRWSRLQTGRD